MEKEKMKKMVPSDSIIEKLAKAANKKAEAFAEYAKKLKDADMPDRAKWAILHAFEELCMRSEIEDFTSGSKLMRAKIIERALSKALGITVDEDD